MVSFPPPPPGEAVRVSATTFVAWRRCPESARARLDGHYGPETRRSFVGALAHRVFARHLDRGPVEPGMIEQVCREEIGSALNPKLADLGLRPSQLREVIDEVGELYQRFRRLAVERPEGVEVTLEVEPAEGVTLVGAIDAVFEDEAGVRLVDWKTGGIGEPGDQLDFYALVWTFDRGEPPKVVEALSVKTGERFEARPGADDLAVVADAVSRLVGEMRRAWEEGGELDREAGPWCRYCPVLASCPEGRTATSIIDGTTR